MLLTFNEPVIVGSGSKIVLTDTSDPSHVVTIADQSLLSVGSNRKTLTIDVPWPTLRESTEYEVTTADTVAGLVQDLEGNPHAGICGSSGLLNAPCVHQSFAAPTVYRFSTHDRSPPVLVQDPTLEPLVGCSELSNVSTQAWTCVMYKPI